MLRTRFLPALIAMMVLTGCASNVSHEEAFQAAQELAPAAPAGTSGTGTTTGVVPGDTGAVPTGTGASVPDTTGVAPGAVASGAPGAANPNSTTAPVADGNSGAGAASGGVAANRDPITIASVSTLSGIVGEAYVNGLKALRAWVSDVNSRGGASGHQIKLLVADDGGTPSKNQSLMQQMVEQNKVQAFVWNTAPLSGQASVAYVQGKKIPVIGSEAADAWFNENSMYFPQQSTASFGAKAFAFATAGHAKAQNANKVSLTYCLESAACKAAVAPEAFTQAGMQVVQQAGFSLAQPDFTSLCLSARNSGADTLFIAADSQSIIRFADNCTNIGYKPLYAWTAQGTTNTLLANKNLENGVVGSTGAPWFAAKTPAQQEFQRVFAKYVPGVKPDGAAVTGWTSAKLFEKALEKMTGAPSSAAILKGLWSITKEDLGGMTYPMTFREGDPNNAVHETACYWTVVIKGGQWTTPDNFARSCK
jgi:ABC-type branched-subunit amino acid transport system substrate-binding protein